MHAFDLTSSRTVLFCAKLGEDGQTAAKFAVPETNGGREGTVTASVCLPRAVAPDIVPVILAFLYTDKLVQEPDFGSDGFAQEYLDPGVEGHVSMSTAAEQTEREREGERCRPRRRSGCGFGGDSTEVGTITGTDWDRGNGVPGKVGTNYQQ